MRFKIFVCHYKLPVLPLQTPLFSYLVSGERSAADGFWLGDLDGDNIAADNHFSELRHHYYVWKNLLSQYDYVGFEHYRRMLFIDLLPPERPALVAPDLLHIRSWVQLVRRWRRSS